MACLEITQETKVKDCSLGEVEFSAYKATFDLIVFNVETNKFIGVKHGLTSEPGDNCPEFIQMTGGDSNQPLYEKNYIYPNANKLKEAIGEIL